MSTNRQAATRGFVYMLAFGLALLHMPSGIPVPFYPLYQDQLGITSTTVSMLFATYIAGVVIALVFMPRLLFYRRVLVAACLLSVAGNFVFLFAASTAELYLGHLIQGLVLGVFTGVVPVALGRIDLSGASKLAGRITTSANAIGLTAGPLWSGLLLAYAPFGGQLVWWIQIVATLAITPFMTIDELERDGKANRAPPPGHHFRGFLSHRLTVTALVAGFCAFASGGLLAALGSVTVDTVMGEDNAAVQGFIVSICFALSAVFGAMKLKRSNAGTIRLGLAWIAAGSAGLALSVLAQSIGVLALAATFCGIGQGFGLQGATQAVGQKSSASEAGKAISFFFILCYFGTVLSSFGVGLVIVYAGLGPAFVGFSVGLLALCVIGAFSTADQNIGVAEVESGGQ